MFPRQVFGSKSSTALFSQRITQQSVNGKNEGCVSPSVAKLPEEINRQVLKTVVLLCEQGVHQLLVGLSLPFQIVMLLHKNLPVPHQPLFQLAV